MKGVQNMETITILANALSKAYKQDISRLDIQFNAKEDSFVGYLTFTTGFEFGIFENGEIRRL